MGFLLNNCSTEGIKPCRDCRRDYQVNGECYIESYIFLIHNTETRKVKIFKDVRELMLIILKSHNIIDEIPYFIAALKQFPEYATIFNKIQILL